ncbi:hypothetical protein ACFQZ4_08890 [Catellatospora coxensis]|uniref:Uncharacterized protein n=1 Tax=Catellatospora coxensis TaxID=310354 RepID=A0A8J3KSS2_9ACTN|nr:hypothetical protein [Catellatospora coxensis]GIG08397.1 hypothetical protein Cco03nite_50970 [Catellatospora coxensis]
MTDPTTEGYTVTTAEINGMVRNLCAYALSEPDPLQRYADLTHQQVLFEGIVAAIQRERGRALADLAVSGVPLDEVAKKTNLAAVPRVRKLISLAGETERVRAAATAAKPAKSKQPKSTPAPEPVAPPAPPVAVAGKRIMTPEEWAALGLADEGPRSKPKKRRRAAAA